VWSTLQRIDLASVKLADSTRATLNATRTVVLSRAKYPKGLRNVVVIAVDHQSFDGVFGDVGSALGRADLRAGADVTPNLHALAQRYALANNFYADANTPGLGTQVLISGMATTFAETKADADDSVFAGDDDPEDAPRIGSVFEALARRNLSYRDYGGLLDVAGFADGTYGYDVPAPAALAGHVDLEYPGPDPAISDLRRADAFARDYDALVASDSTPRFAYVWLPGTQTADTDAAIGAMVEHLSHLITWRNTAVIVVAADTAGASDHVDAARAFALVISPYAKAHYTGDRHLSTASVLKTVDGILWLPPLSLGDLLAGDMSAFFGSAPDARPYVAVRANAQ
jgi:hypothetical protein